MSHHFSDEFSINSIYYKDNVEIIEKLKQYFQEGFKLLNVQNYGSFSELPPSQSEINLKFPCTYTCNETVYLSGCLPQPNQILSSSKILVFCKSTIIFDFVYSIDDLTRSDFRKAKSQIYNTCKTVSKLQSKHENKLVLILLFHGFDKESIRNHFNLCLRRFELTGYAVYVSFFASEIWTELIEADFVSQELRRLARSAAKVKSPEKFLELSEGSTLQEIYENTIAAYVSLIFSVFAVRKLKV